MSLSNIRQAYDTNYDKMLAIIGKMGGNDCINDHRAKQTQLYRRLKDLQKHEHYLNEMENRLLGH